MRLAARDCGGLSTGALAHPQANAPRYERLWYHFQRFVALPE